MNLVSCPHCKKQFEISQALQEQLRGDVEKEYEEKITEARKEAIEKTLKKAEEDASLRLKDLENQNNEEKERNKKLGDQLLELNKTLRDLQAKDKERDLEMEKKLREEEEKIRLDAQKKAEEEQHTKILEKDKQLADVLKKLEEANRKLQQGSQQTQGEVFELEFESMLKRQYPNDKIIPVGKGIRGGDIIQEVWDRRGNCSGKILWELKNTKTWSEAWIDKLKDDQRSITAEEAVLISEVLPNDIKIAGFRNSVWVTQRGFVVPLADTLRAKLIQMYYVKRSVQGKNEKMEVLYAYLSGTEFKHRIEAIVEAFTRMQEEIEKEKRYFTNKWARDEKNIRQVIDNTYGMHGDLKGIIGAVLPQIQGLDVLEIESGDTHG